MWIVVITPDFLSTVMSTTMPDCEFAKLPSAIPRPVTTCSLDRFDAATFGFQLASFTGRAH